MRKNVIGLLTGIIVVSVIGFIYFDTKQVNPVTGKKQSIDLTAKQEVLLGLQCAPQLAVEFGGLYQDRLIRSKVKMIGRRLAASAEADGPNYQFDFHVLADSLIANAFALPGGQIFITYGFLKKLKTDDEIATVLAHEIGHVMGRHATEKLQSHWFRNLKSDVTPSDHLSHQTTQYVADLIQLEYGNVDEFESDNLAVRYLIGAGYKPDALLKIVNQPAIPSTANTKKDFEVSHPVTDNRKEKISAAIADYRRAMIQG